MNFFATHYSRFHLGLLFLRIGLGLTFMAHGYPKLAGGPDGWFGLGGAMANWGITFVPVFWGFMGAITEFAGGLLLLLGLFFRPVCILLVITMATATLMHVNKGDSFSDISHALEMGIVFFSLYFIGPGRYSLDFKLSKNQDPGVAY